MNVLLQEFLPERRLERAAGRKELWLLGRQRIQRPSIMPLWDSLTSARSTCQPRDPNRARLAAGHRVNFANAAGREAAMSRPSGPSDVDYNVKNTRGSLVCVLDK